MKKFKIISTLVFSMFACGFLMGQQNPWDIWMNPQTDDFATIRQNVENYYANIDKDARGTGYKQWKRWEYLQQDRLTDDGKIVNYASRNFQEYHAYMDSQGSRGVTVTNGYWSALGPYYFVDGNGWNGGIGRVNSITFHPTNSSTIWVGCPSGGLWKTTTGVPTGLHLQTECPGLACPVWLSIMIIRILCTC